MAEGEIMQNLGSGQFKLDLWATYPVCPHDGHVMRIIPVFVDAPSAFHDSTGHTVTKAMCCHCGSEFTQSFRYWYTAPHEDKD